jgi:predicted secreted hydrolase
MGKLIKFFTSLSTSLFTSLSSLLTVMLLVVIVFAVIVFASSGIDKTSSNIKALFSNVKSTALDTGDETSQQQFGRGFSASDPQNLGQVADPNYVITFPKDHYSHDSFDIEWWYLTANLQDDEGNDYGLQWTLFRFRNQNAKLNKSQQTKLKDNIDDGSLTLENRPKALGSDWSNEHIYMAHASVHSASKHWFSEKFARGNVGNAGVEQTPFKLFIDDWQWQSPTAGLLPSNLTFTTKLISNNASGNSAISNSAKGKGENSNTDSYLNVQLNLSNTGPFVLQGQGGYSIKSANGKHASHYYSAPFIEVEGTFTLGDSGKQIAVNGNAWFDQEWTSQLLDQTTLGWDWLSLHLDNGDKIMAFQMRLQDQADYITGTYINADGSTTALMPSDIKLNANKLTSVGNKKLPLYWQLKIKSKDIDISIKATKNDQWNPASIAYYEGTVAVSGTHSGKGFLELTGY